MRSSHDKRKHAVFLAVLAILTFAFDAAACPGCTYQRMLTSDWYPKTFLLKLALPVLFTVNRLDPIRVCYVFLAYTFVFIQTFKFLVWHMMDESVLSVVCPLVLLVLALNIPEAALLLFLSRFRFFRRDPLKPLPTWQAVVFAAVSTVTGWSLFRV